MHAQVPQAACGTAADHTLGWGIYVSNKVYFLRTIIKINNVLPRKLVENVNVSYSVIFQEQSKFNSSLRTLLCAHATLNYISLKESLDLY